MEQATNMSEAGAGVQRLGCDLVNAAAAMSTGDARYLVDAYYALQDRRKTSASEARPQLAENERHSVIAWFHDQCELLEKEIERALEAWTDTQPAARWAKSITGVGPVIAAGLASQIDLSKCRTVADIWAFAGIDARHRRPRRRCNASLKRLCLKLGESFAGTFGPADEFYGRQYEKRKDHEIAANDAGKFAEQARRKLERCNVGKTGGAQCPYADGKLPCAHITQRAKRWVVKLFLSHYFEVALLFAGQEPVKPFAISVLNRVHHISPPNFSGSATEVN